MTRTRALLLAVISLIVVVLPPTTQADAFQEAGDESIIGPILAASRVEVLTGETLVATATQCPGPFPVGADYRIEYTLTYLTPPQVPGASPLGTFSQTYIDHNAGDDYAWEILIPLGAPTVGSAYVLTAECWGNELGSDFLWHADYDPVYLTVSQGDALCEGLPVTRFVADGQNGTSGDDVILGSPGPDWIEASEGNDVVCGGRGIDRIYGGPGNDRIHGEGGSDRIWAGTGNDTVLAGSGADWVDGGEGDDKIRGMGGQDRLSGGPGDDVIQGNFQSDLLSGGPGDDVLGGAAGKDRLFGGDGDDLMYGGPNMDLLVGGAGFDIANGQQGIDNPYVPGVSGCQAEVQLSC